MDALEAIFARQSVSRVRPDPVPRETIKKLLSAAVQAPNHYRVRPWRLFVLTGDARNRLGEVLAQSLLQRIPDCSPSALEAERARPLRAPVVIAVAVDPPVDSKVIEIENVCAAAAAVQNLLVAASALGLGAMWRTGPAAYNPDVKAYLGLSPDQHLIAFVYVGYPLGILDKPERPSFDDRTTWLE
jgi:nitroreductase